MTVASVFRTWLRRVWIAGGLLVTAWLAWNLQAHGVPALLFESDGTLTVTVQRDRIFFVPRDVAAAKRVALVFIPGGLVDPTAYVPVVRAIAATGVRSALVEMPWRAAMTETARTELWRRIVEAYNTLGPDLPLIVAGHSRGAAMAAHFAHEHPTLLRGLILIGTTHPRDQDLSGAPYPVLKILGSRDCVASAAGARENAAKLPIATTWTVIEGANHAQFGYYGSQINDCRAEISRAEQQQQLIAAVTAFLSRSAAFR